ncbi:MAG TPA: N-methyl-L-tryptophan oxidase [Solirubrobacteraceae bacterium]|jgi:sarcosine oxidase|nr:N-methyl-L-tryptophan oxidase [Solirubrobacteraceae bacterium]
MAGTYDAIVVGLGAIGSSVTYQLAKAGASVLGLDRHEPPHALGSTHGRTRITRLALGEGGRYVPFVRRSHALWREIEREAGESLMIRTGGLVLAVEGASGTHGAEDFLGTTIAAAREHGIEHELLAPEDVAARYPALALTGRERPAYFEPETGFVRPERAVAAQLRLAERHGAAIRTGERALSVSGGRVATDRGEYAAATVIAAAGPWVGELLPAHRERFTVYRQVQYWFDLAGDEAYERHRELPIFIWELGGGPDDFVYGFPAIDGPDGGVKVATEQHTTPTTADACAREVSPDEIRAMHEQYVAPRLPGLTARCLRATTCLYTVTADRGFVLGPDPSDERLLIASPCSGHGFKHSPAIGEAIAQLIAAGRSDLDVSAFALAP